MKIVTQFEMSILDSLGLLKVDFLGLATLSIMARACDLIRQRHGIEYNLDNIPVDDPATFELLGRGETAGVFQVEGSGMRRYLMQMKPKGLANVIAMVALFRPGPMDFIPGYIRRMHGEEPVTYRHPLLEPIFKETYGYPVYQEQLMFAVMQLAGYTAPEADDLRKAVAKKIKDKLHKHREKFIRGAVKNGIVEETAGAIFDDWEEFARYGFNKAHAADYGVIAVQTGYLKTHYTVEYMTALLSVNLNDTAKVALYSVDCRRMGIRVEPPDVTVSGWDFTVEDHEGGTSSIRFGLGAVKNVGYAPVETILAARSKGPFKDLNDFAHRVDLRQVGKRALESLIKVGALDCFGSRTALLEGLDRIIAVSGSHFRAADMGQMSLFGAHSGVSEEIILPPATNEISRREILNWERELIGLYVSDHPLSPVMDELAHTVTHFSAQLGEAQQDERVRVAGLITRIRHHQSKTGKPMGFVTIEDVQGSIDLVIFPSTWTKVADMIDYDRIIIVEGRADINGAEPKVLVESISTDFKVTEPLASITLPAGSPPVFAGADAPPDMSLDTDYPASAFEDNDPGDGVPPPPEAFPMGWEGQAYNGLNLGQMAVQVFAAATPDDAMPAPLETALASPPAPAEAPAGEPSEPDPDILPHTTTPVLPVAVAPIDVNLPEKPVLMPPYLVSPVTTTPEAGKLHMITVILRASGDKTRDVLRLRRIHGTAMSYPGSDRFAFHVYERGRGYLVEFPNFTTGLCSELIARLNLLVGAENVRVELITIQ